MNYKTEQEEFWTGEFGNEYTDRNSKDKYLVASNISLFAKAFQQVGKPESLIEFDANIGLNLMAIKLLFPSIKLNAIEINKKAATELGEVIGDKNIFNGSILEYEPEKKFDIVLIKGVLIHINPEMLPAVYERLYKSSKKYIMICEYYNPVPVTVNYRGHSDRLFKRDFAGEMLDLYPDLKLSDYEFIYKRDRAFPQDDATWFLLEKE
jgi:pseudaminic acid biosynthesis-associated methylase